MFPQGCVQPNYDFCYVVTTNQRYVFDTYYVCCHYVVTIFTMSAP